MLRELSVRLSTGRGHWCKGRNARAQDAEPSAVAQRDERHSRAAFTQEEKSVPRTVPADDGAGRAGLRDRLPAGRHLERRPGAAEADA
jgi:hypothetical protein